MRCIYTKLIDYADRATHGSWRPTGAAAIEQVDPTHVRFTLRPGIMFTNGFGEMTADDVKFSYERIADPAQQSEYADDFAQLDHVEVDRQVLGRDRAEGAVRAALDQLAAAAPRAASSAGRRSSRRAAASRPSRRRPPAPTRSGAGSPSSA